MRCEGWTLPGSFMTFGPRRWVQCENKAVVMLTVIQDKKKSDQPACLECWNTAIERGIVIKKARPLTKEEQKGGEKDDHT